MNQAQSHGSLKSYISGFILSVLCTVLAFVVMQEHLLTGSALISVVVFLAIVQAWIQLQFFLHVGFKSRWTIAIFISTMSIILILVIGSLWIMHHLNYNMTSEQMDTHILYEEGMDTHSY